MTKRQNDKKSERLWREAWLEKMNDIINGDLKMNEQTLPPTLSISDVQTSNTTNRISIYKLHTNWYNKYLWHEHQRHLWGLYLNATLILRQKDRKIIREGVFWDFVPNVGPHPPTAHVWDSTKWKVEVRFILLFGLFRAFCFFEKVRGFSDKIPCIYLGLWTPTHPPPPLF